MKNKINKEVVPATKQPRENPSIRSIPQIENGIPREIDLLAKELQKEAMSLKFQNTPKFPCELFPKPIREFIHDTSQALSCPPDFVGMGVLACASVAIGNGVVLELKKSWITGASLYCAIVAEPGSAKTPAISKAVKPLFDIQKYNLNEYESKKAQYELEKGNYEIELDKWKKSLNGKLSNKLQEKPSEPKTPTFQQIVTMDSTMEALQEILAFNGRGVLKLHDELLGFFKGMNQYRVGADRQYYLSIWSNEPIIVNRKGKEPLQIQKPYVSIVGGIQPEMLDEIIRGEHSASGNDGFIDRFLFCYPDSVPSNWTDEDVREEVIHQYCEIITDIYFKLNEANPKNIVLGPKAREAYTDWYDDTERETLEIGFPEILKGVWRKLKGIHPRIMIIMHMLKWSSDQKTVDINVIDEETVVYTNYIMDFFKKHAQKVFQITYSNNQDKYALKLIEHVRRKGEKTEDGISIRVNALNQGKVFGRSTNIKLIEEVIERFERENLGRIESYLYNNQVVRTFVLNSKLLED